MSFATKPTSLISLMLLSIVFLTSPALMAETREQKVRLKLLNPGDSANCQVQAVFKGDHDNCKNDGAKGRGDCSKDSGCVCTRQEKHISWEIENKEHFNIVFDQGSDNPFVQKGSHECNFKGNKKGKLRCRVKGKDVPKAIYRYSITSPDCKSAQSQIKIY